MWFNPRPNVTLLCVSTNDKMKQSNVVPPIGQVQSLILIKNRHPRVHNNVKTVLTPLGLGCPHSDYLSRLGNTLWVTIHSLC